MVPNRPDLWWKQVENKLQFLKVPNENKLNYIMTGLDLTMVEKSESAFDINPFSQSSYTAQRLGH